MTCCILVYDFQVHARSVTSHRRLEDWDSKYQDENSYNYYSAKNSASVRPNREEILRTELFQETNPVKVSVRSTNENSPCPKCYRRNPDGKCRKMFGCKIS